MDLDYNKREEIVYSMTQAAGVLILRTWEEASKLFLEYIIKSPYSPYRNMLSIFARKDRKGLLMIFVYVHY